MESSLSFSLIRYLTLQLEYNLLERQVFAHLESRQDDIVQLESIYFAAHELEEKAIESRNYMSSSEKLAQKAKVIKTIIRDFYCQGEKCYFNF
jgi:hypothetical protein